LVAVPLMTGVLSTTNDGSLKLFISRTTEFRIFVIWLLAQLSPCPAASAALGWRPSLAALNTCQTNWVGIHSEQGVTTVLNSQKTFSGFYKQKLR
jgi:hypothetical protein